MNEANRIFSLFPDFINGNSLAGSAFLLIIAAGPFLVLFSNVWSQFWKSPRFFLILALMLGVPFLNHLTTLQSAGTLNAATPFSQDYRIAEVLYPENQKADPAVRIDLHNFADSNTLRIYRNGDDYETIGSFSYLEPAQTQTEKGIWVLTPADNPQALYRVAVEADDSVTLSYSEKEQLRWKWLLRKEYVCSLSVATFGHTMYMNPDWLLPEEADPEPYFKHTDVTGSATVTIAVPGFNSSTLQLIEEYHHAGRTETTEYLLEPVKDGTFAMEVTTRYDGKQEYALYRIPYQAGEFRFVLTFDVDAKDAFRELIDK